MKLFIVYYLLNEHLCKALVYAENKALAEEHVQEEIIPDSISHSIECTAKIISNSEVY